jgi:hypothetical protein
MVLLLEPVHFVMRAWYSVACFNATVVSAGCRLRIHSQSTLSLGYRQVSGPERSYPRGGIVRCLTRRVASIVMSTKVTHQMLWLQCRKPMIAV